MTADTIRRQQIALITGSSESNEWYTPAPIIARAREVLGGIDLDPASCPRANEIVQAVRYFTAEDDGYNQSWHGRVWLNPPYGKQPDSSETKAIRWSRKLIREYRAGHISSALLLVKAALGYSWFQELMAGYPTCFLFRRLSFVSPTDRITGQAKHPTAILYLGPNVAQFESVFDTVGFVVLPKQPPICELVAEPDIHGAYI